MNKARIQLFDSPYLMPDTAKMRNRTGMILALAACAAFCCFELWFLGATKGAVCHGASRGDLVDSYVEALAQGKTYLQTPIARLAELPADRQPATDVRFRIADASFFQGRYYLYYGILPFAAVLAPWKLLTGTYLNAECFIGAGLVLGNSMLLISFFRLYRADVRHWAMTFCPVGLVIALSCSGILALMDVPDIHQVESATAYVMNCAIFLGLVFFLESNRTRFGFLLMAVAAAALLMGCRPNQAFTVAWVTGLAVFWVLRAIPAIHKRKLVTTIMLIPVAIGGALSAYNHARFGNVLEFGMNYGTGAVSRAEVVGFSTAKIPYNLSVYLLGRFQVEPYFPFIGGPLRPDQDGRPENHEGFDQVYGMLVIYPALIFAAAAFYYRRNLAVILAIPLLTNLLFLAGLGFGTYRYSVDFGAFWAILAGIGCIEFCATQQRLRLMFSGLATILLMVVSVAGAICLCSSVASIHALFDRRRPDDFRMIAAPFNSVRYECEKMMGFEPRAISADIRFPEKYGAVEPLLVTGWRGLQDFIYVHYYDRGLIRIGFESMGRGGFVSAPIPVDYSKTHRIDLVLGNGFPPPDHPLFAEAKSRPGVESPYGILEIFIDGASVVRSQVQFHPRKGYEYLGRSPFDAAFGRVFTGDLARVDGLTLRSYLKMKP